MIQGWNIVRRWLREFIQSVNLSDYQLRVDFPRERRFDQLCGPVGGSYDFTFALFNGNSTSCTQIGVTQTNLALAVSNGLFCATLDFGSVFGGDPAWLAVGVRGSGEPGFTPLTPLQPVTPMPYALCPGAVATNGVVPLAALPAAVVTNGAGGLSLSGPLPL